VGTVIGTTTTREGKRECSGDPLEHFIYPPSAGRHAGAKKNITISLAAIFITLFIIYSIHGWVVTALFAYFPHYLWIYYNVS
jgi:hypothetical protein